MPKARISYGIELDYTDSGPPRTKGSDGSYDTLICVHGPLFNKEIFSPLFSASPPSLRLITYNHRGFKGSSPITSDGGLSEYILRRTTYTEDLISFLEWISHKLCPPKIPIVLSWGRAGNLLLSIASPKLLDSSLRQRALSSIGGLILLDCPGAILGRVPTNDVVDSAIGFPAWENETDATFGLPNGFLSPYSSHPADGDCSRTPSDRLLSWVCGFYKHTLPPERRFSTNPCFYNTWAYKCSSNLEQKVINAAYQPDTYDSVAEFFKVKDSIDEQREFARGALAGQEDVPVVMLWNAESPESMVDAARGGIEMGADVRRCSEKGNAFFFVHEAKRFCEVVRKIMDGMGKDQGKRKGKGKDGKVV